MWFFFFKNNIENTFIDERNKLIAGYSAEGFSGRRIEILKYKGSEMCCFGTGRSIAAFDSFDGTLLIVGGTIGVQKI